MSKIPKIINVHLLVLFSCVAMGACSTSTVYRAPFNEVVGEINKMYDPANFPNAIAPMNSAPQAKPPVSTTVVPKLGLGYGRPSIESRYRKSLNQHDVFVIIPGVSDTITDRTTISIKPLPDNRTCVSVVSSSPGAMKSIRVKQREQNRLDEISQQLKSIVRKKKALKHAPRR